MRSLQQEELELKVVFLSHNKNTPLVPIASSSTQEMHLFPQTCIIKELVHSSILVSCKQMMYVSHLLLMKYFKVHLLFLLFSPYKFQMSVLTLI